MPLRLFNTFLAQMKKVHVVMEKLAARVQRETIVAVLFPMVYVVKTGIPVAPKDKLVARVKMEDIGAVLFLTVFVVKNHMAVAPKEALVASIIGELFAAIILMLFVVKTRNSVVPMQPNVI